MDQVVTIERLARGIVGGRFLKDLEVGSTALDMRKRNLAPGMLSLAERAMLQQLVSTTWRGEGAIIDGGSFFGSSLVASAEGVRASKVLDQVPTERFPEDKPIHGYELGFLPAPESDNVDRRRQYAGVEYYLGESFVPILENTVAPYRDLIALHIGDLNEKSWDGSPIEIAFIDVCKTSRLNAHVSKEFYPALIPGASTLINQDFFFDRLPWIRVTMGYLKEYFTWEGQVFSSSIYRNVKAVPADVASFDPFLEASYDECLAFHDAIEYPGIERRFEFLLEVSRAYLAALQGGKDDALDMLKYVESAYADVLGDVDNPRGNQFRLDRAVRQITNGNIFKVS